MDTLAQFRQRVLDKWLPTYCAARGYDLQGFKHASLRVDAADARDCMVAIDRGILVDKNDGKYRAHRSSAHEVLFWEGAKAAVPRPISLWHEPVITFAALARLHIDHAWPIEALASQPPGWAFDVAAYCAEDTSPTILGEVKKSVQELERLRSDLLALACGSDDAQVLPNSKKKWEALLVFRPRVVWLLGPGGMEYVFEPVYASAGASFRAVGNVALQAPAA